MSVCVLLTGRKGSSLRDKSFLSVSGSPCIDLILKEVCQVSEVDHFFCSSDCQKILNKAESFGLKSINRPSSLGSDDAQHIDVIKHALNTISDEYKIRPSILIVVLANNPIIFRHWIRMSLSLIEKNSSISSVVPVYEYSDHSPFRSKEINQDGFLQFPPHLQAPNNLSTNRQSLPSTYFLCHNFWTLNLSRWKNGEYTGGDMPWKFLGPKTKPLIVPKSHDIHTIDDVKICEQIINWYSSDETNVLNVKS